MAKNKKDKSDKTSSNKLHITVIEGDGIGHEVVPEGIRVLEVIGRKSLTSALGSTLSTSTFTRSIGQSVRESRYVVGMSYLF